MPGAGEGNLGLSPLKRPGGRHIGLAWTRARDDTAEFLGGGTGHVSILRWESAGLNVGSRSRDIGMSPYADAPPLRLQFRHHRIALAGVVFERGGGEDATGRTLGTSFGRPAGCGIRPPAGRSQRIIGEARGAGLTLLVRERGLCPNRFRPSVGKSVVSGAARVARFLPFQLFRRFFFETAIAGAPNL
jgi:hypothetical protein